MLVLQYVNNTMNAELKGDGNGWTAFTNTGFTLTLIIIFMRLLNCVRVLYNAK